MKRGTATRPPYRRTGSLPAVVSRHHAQCLGVFCSSSRVVSEEPVSYLLVLDRLGHPIGLEVQGSTAPERALLLVVFHVLVNIHAVHVDELRRIPTGQFPETAETLHVALLARYGHGKDGRAQIRNVDGGARRQKGRHANVRIDDVLERVILDITAHVGFVGAAGLAGVLRPVQLGNRYRAAWRLLHVGCLCYQYDETVTPTHLADIVARCELVIGDFDLGSKDRGRRPRNGHARAGAAPR
jgi:hypothetical protein